VYLQGSIVELSSRVVVEDPAAFADMSALMFNSQMLQWRLRGHVDVTVTVWGVSIVVNDVLLDKVVQLPGTALATSLHCHTTPCALLAAHSRDVVHARRLRRLQERRDLVLCAERHGR
jgi:hypothetical protein